MYMSLNNFDYPDLINKIVDHYDLQDEYLTRDCLSRIFENLKNKLDDRLSILHSEDDLDLTNLNDGDRLLLEEIEKNLLPNEEIESLQILNVDGKIIEYGNVLITFPIILIKVV